MNTSANGSLLGLPDSLTSATRRNLQASLLRLWNATVGPLGSLQDDLEECRRWFDPVAQGQRLRRELSELKSCPDVDSPGPPLTLTVGPNKRLVTPEGRCALDLLQGLPDETLHFITDLELVPYDRLLGNTYRDWSRHRLQSVVGLLQGSNKPLQIPAAGVVIALLANRCTAENRALTRFASGSRRDVVDQAFFTAVQAFADVLAPGRRASRSARLVSGWMLYEAKRRLGDGLVMVDARAGIDGKVWIRPEAEAGVIDLVARDLARGHRARASSHQFATAFDALVDALRKELPTLAGFGLVHERPQDTVRLRNRLIEAFDGYLHQVS